MKRIFIILLTLFFVFPFSLTSYADYYTNEYEIVFRTKDSYENTEYEELFPDSGNNHIVSTDGEKNSFSFTLSDDSVLTVNVSKNPLQLRPVEEENMDSVTEIKRTSVLFLKGYDDGGETAFTAYFKNKGVYYRITQQGKSLSEEKFVDIIKSLL